MLRCHQGGLTLEYGRDAIGYQVNYDIKLYVYIYSSLFIYIFISVISYNNTDKKPVKPYEALIMILLMYLFTLIQARLLINFSLSPIGVIEVNPKIIPAS